LIIIKHRVNTINEIISTPYSYGVEIDLRTFGSEIIIHHDPFHEGVKFSEWLQYYNHKFLVLNVKEDGLETFISELIEKFKVKNYFFLDVLSTFCCLDGFASDDEVGFFFNSLKQMSETLSVYKIKREN
jgi:hypothetical protein